MAVFMAWTVRLVKDVFTEKSNAVFWEGMGTGVKADPVLFSAVCWDQSLMLS